MFGNTLGLSFSTLEKNNHVPHLQQLRGTASSQGLALLVLLFV